MIHTSETLQNGIELLENRRLHFKISIATLQEQIDKYEKEIVKLDYKIYKTKEALDSLEQNTDI